MPRLLGHHCACGAPICGTVLEVPRACGATRRGDIPESDGLEAVRGAIGGRGSWNPKAAASMEKVGGLGWPQPVISFIAGDRVVKILSGLAMKGWDDVTVAGRGYMFG